MQQDSFQIGVTGRRPVQATWRLVAALAATALLGGCEAPLRLEGVVASESAPIALQISSVSCVDEMRSARAGVSIPK